MSGPDVHDRNLFDDLLRFVKAMAQGDQDGARQAAQCLEESLEELLGATRQNSETEK